MVTQFSPLQPPSLDPRGERELVRRCLDRVFTASGGRLNDFSAGSVPRALIEAQALAGAELLFQVNKLPEAYSIRFLQIMGIQRRLGAYAKVRLSFTLVRPLSSPFVIPTGFLVSSGTVLFATDEVLTIPAGYTVGEVNATAQQLGRSGNVAAYRINRILQPLSYLKSVTNPSPASGGLGAESLDEVKARAFASIRRRGLVSKDDYEQETVTFLGAGSVAHAIGNLGADKVTIEKGSCHVFVLNPDGSLLNSAQLSTLQSHLSARTHLGVATYVSNIQLQPVDVWVIADLIPGTNPQTIASTINQRLQAYLKPGQRELGATILVKELEYEVKLAGVETVNTVLIGDHLGQSRATNYPLPFQYSAAQLLDVRVQLVSGPTTFEYGFGEGDPD